MTFAPTLPPSRPAIAASAQDLDDAEFAELDGLLASVPEPLDPLDAVMLDGFLCGVIVQPELIDAGLWLPYVFDAGGHRWGEAEPSLERARAEALVLRRHAALNRSIAEHGGFHPFILEPSPDDEPSDGAEATPVVDPIDAAVLPWVAGFGSAVELFPSLADLPDAVVSTTLARLYRFLPAEDEQEREVAAIVARERPMPTLDDAIDEVVMCVAELYDITAPLRYKVEAVRRDAPKIGRNDPCRVRQRPEMEAVPRQGRRRLMRLQLLSDLHLETEDVVPQVAPDAELLVLAGDIDSHWAGLELFRDWPVPVVFVAGNHEFDHRELTEAMPQLRERCASLGMTMLERERIVVTGSGGEKVRIVGTTRWSDYDLYGAVGRAKAMRAAAYFMRLMAATQDGEPFDAPAMRREALACRAWLHDELQRQPDGWDRTVVITHFAPSLKSADPRYGASAATASFCNADDDLLPAADLWLHGHLHCVHDYVVAHADGRRTRVVSNARGHSRRGEAERHQPRFVLEV